MRIIVTGGAGFIGSNLIHFLAQINCKILNVDSLSYAGNLNSLKSISNNSNYSFISADISNYEQVDKIFKEFKPDKIINLAAESHVDNSIENSNDFIKTNIVGTHVLLEVTRNYLENNKNLKSIFRFLHVSTDEVFGDLEKFDGRSTEESPYLPNSPYAASKAASDHLVRAWGRTYKLPIMITNCSNNFGPYQYPEKFIPVIILNAINGSNIPIYGDGLQIRDWLFVTDHVAALYSVLTNGKVGETYNIGAENECDNISLTKKICSIFDKIEFNKSLKPKSYANLISFVKDRPGHDRRYSIDSTKIRSELKWNPKVDFNTGLKMTVTWFIENQSWWRPLLKLK